MKAEAQERHERSDVRRNMERVLQAAESLFAEHGHNVKIGDVAARAGVGVGTVYRRFRSKELLFAAVSRAACADTSHCLAQAIEQERDPVAQLRAIVHAQFHHSLRHAALLDSPDDEPQSAQPGLYPALHALLVAAISAGQTQGCFRAGDPAMLAALCMEFLAPRAVRRLCASAGSCDEAATHAADFVLAGLRA
jgi:AcrR family transcriptional regulator